MAEKRKGNISKKRVDMEVAESIKASIKDAKEVTANVHLAVEKYPKIVDGYWHVWDAKSGEFKNEGIKAQGEISTKIPVCKVCIPIAEEGRKLTLKSVEGLEVGGLLTKFIVPENADTYWQSRVIESTEEYEYGTKITTTDNLCRPRATWEGWANSTGSLGFGGVPNKDELQEGQRVYFEGTIADEENKPCWLLGTVDYVTNYVYLKVGTRIFLDKSPFNIYVTLKSAGFSKVITEPLNESSLLSDGLLIYEDGKTVGNVTLTEEQLGEDFSIINGTDLGVFNEVGFGAFVNGHHNKSTGIMSHTTGEFNTNTGYRASCENSDNTVSGKNSSVKGYGNIVSGDVSSAEGNSNEVTSDNAHVEGMRNKVTGKYGHGEGYGNIVASDYQHVQGRWNEEDSEGKYVDIVGYGSGPEPENRKNIYTLDTEGNAEFAGNILCIYGNEVINLGEALTGIETALSEIEAMADSLIGGDV